MSDLETRWSNCLALGAQATVEMQKEAQRVAAENSVLRQLLNEQGIDEKSIESRVKIALIESSSTFIPKVRTSKVALAILHLKNCVMQTCTDLGCRIDTTAPVEPIEPRSQGQDWLLPSFGGVTVTDFAHPFVAAPATPNISGSTTLGLVYPPALDWDAWMKEMSSIKDAFGIEAQAITTLE